MPHTNTSPSLPFSEPMTSRDAALSMAPHATAQGTKVLEYIRGRGAYGATQKECSADLGLSRQSVAPRFFELVKAGCIFKGRERRQACAVFFIVPGR